MFVFKSLHSYDEELVSLICFMKLPVPIPLKAPLKGGLDYSVTRELRTSCN